MQLAARCATTVVRSHAGGGVAPQSASRVSSAALDRFRANPARSADGP